MPRQLRIEYAGAIYHVMNRGDRREPIFHDDLDRKRFFAALGEVCAKTDWQVHAYCRMNNHFHLVMETPNANLVAGMNMTATNGMTKRDPHKSQHRMSFTLLTCPVREERSVGFPSLPLISCPTQDFRFANRDHLSFRTLQHKGHPHPVLSKSTPRNFPLGLSPKISRSTELEARLSLAL